MPLYKKKGHVNNPDNYRGITLLSCVGKFFTSVLNYRITNYLEATGSIGDEQAGFRAGHSTIDHIFVLHSIIDIYQQKQKPLYCAFIDYKKAFDFVDRSSLWKKLISHGINGKVLNVIYNLYKNAKSCVKSQGKLSDYFSCNVGVRQGENLSPLLFAIYLNDFEFYVSRKYNGLKDIAADCSTYLSDDDVEIYLRLYVLLYADDTIVMAESAEELQLALNAVYDYCKTWDLTVNTSKTKIVIFSKRKILDYPAFLFGHDIIEVVEDYVYLGVTFNYNGKYDKAMNKQVNLARRALFALLSRARKLQLPVDIQIELFHQLVVPVLLYGCEVWGFNELNQIEVFYRTFLKKLLGVHKRTPNCIVYGETGTSPLYNQVLSRIVGFWARLINGKKTKLSYVMYRLTREMHSRYIENYNFNFAWIELLDRELSALGMSDIWILEGMNGTVDYIKNNIKLRINDCNLQLWSSEVYEHEECTNYRIYKNTLSLEKYLIQLNFQERRNLARFRCRSSFLPLNKSKFFTNDQLNNNVEFDKCVLCHKNVCGDEFHYLFVCPFFDYFRERLIDKAYWERPNIFSLSNLLCSNDVKTQKRLSRFVFIIMDNLKDVFYE